MEKATPPPTRSIKVNTRRILFSIAGLIAIGIVLLAFVYADQKNQTIAAKAGRITIAKDGFIPGDLHIKQGQNVIWTNKDRRAHQIASSSLAEFGSDEPLAPNESYSFIFTKKGTFTYFDRTDPLAKKAKVVVE